MENKQKETSENIKSEVGTPKDTSSVKSMEQESHRGRHMKRAETPKEPTPNTCIHTQTP